MGFNSLAFLYFLPLAWLGFVVLPRRWRELFLVFVSSIFYAYFSPWFLLLLYLIITVDYEVGRYLAKEKSQYRRIVLGLSLFGNLGALAVFKYSDFIGQNITYFAKLIGWNYSIETLGLIVPLGLSFHTFQSLSYIFEVYYRRTPAEPSLFRYALYVLYFPQLVAGPIERPQNLLPQFLRNLEINERLAGEGFRLMLVGFFKKLCIADNLAPLVNQVFIDPGKASSIDVFIAVPFFAIQIFSDFSGYSDIARGVSQMFGVKLSVNFDKPYFSSSLTQFWRRWHISLSGWFKDYVYIPLGGRAGGHSRRILNSIIVFGLSGLWHGANWTYVVWGGLHGVSYSIERLLVELIRKRPRLSRIVMQYSLTGQFLSHLWVLSVVCIGWIFFRATSLSDALELISKMVIFSNSSSQIAHTVAAMDGALLCFCLIVFQYFDSRYGLLELWGRMPSALRLVSYSFFIVAILILASFGDSQFIYFQF